MLNIFLWTSFFPFGNKVPWPFYIRFKQGSHTHQLPFAINPPFPCFISFLPFLSFFFLLPFFRCSSSDLQNRSYIFTGDALTVYTPSHQVVYSVAWPYGAATLTITDDEQTMILSGTYYSGIYATDSG